MDKNNNKFTLAVTVIFFIIQCYIMIEYIRKHEYKHLSSLLTVTLLFLIYTFIKIRLNIFMNIYITNFIILTLLGFNLAGEYIGLFYKSQVYDKLLHIIGTYAFSLFTFTIINHFFPSSSNNKVRDLIYIIAIGAFLGMVFELLEFFADIIMKPDIPNQSDLLDTNLDMITDLFGAVGAALHAFVTDYRVVKTSCRNPL